MANSVTLLFPGQGSQYVGMGKQFIGTPQESYFKNANEVLGYDLAQICYEGPSEELTLTQNTQPAIVTYSCALRDKLLPILQDKKVKIDQVLGHSVGEYAALVAAEVLSHKDASKAVHFRGRFMQDAVPAGVGAMYAIMRVPQELIEKACQEASTERSQVMPANFNEPNQTVISGTKEACERAVKWLEDNFEGRMRAMPLKVSAPFHSSLMKPATEKLARVFEEITFTPNKIPYIANVDAKKYIADTPADTIKQNLLNQVEGSVLWSQSIAQLADETICIEVGPGRVLAGLVKKINPNIKVISLDREGAFTELEDILN
jgi:[acyl-carrier-protein] S-malonyltransferase